MKKIFALIFILSLSKSSFSQVVNSAILQFNNVKARLIDEGGFFTNIAASTAGYEIPKGSSLNTIYTGSYWIGAEDSLGFLHISGKQYSMGGAESSFHSGPISETNAYSSLAYTNLYQNALWKVAAAEIDNHINNYQSSGYIIPPSIANWPGNGDVSLGVAHKLAPFIDLNNNGLYEPALGDYPDIRGDEAVYIIMNDASLPEGNQLGVELHAMFYQFALANYLNNTTFLNLRVINRSNLSYSNYHQALFIDFDIGNYVDDFVGCYPPNNLLFGYNGDDNDAAGGGQLGYGVNPPCQGVVSLSHDLSNACAIPNSNFNNIDADTNIWLLMNSQNADSSFWIDPSTNSPTDFIYPGNPNDPNAWHEQSSNNPPGDRRGILTIQEPNLPTGGSICSDYAFIYDRSGDRLTNVQNVIDIANALRIAYQSSTSFPCQSEQFNLVSQLAVEQPIKIYPNPSAGIFVISNNQPDVMDVSVFDAFGKVVYRESHYNENATISLEGYKGIFMVAVSTKKGKFCQKLILH
jgi:hypothetical protein